MGEYIVMKVQREQAELPDEAVISMKEAARLLGMTIQGVASALNRGAFTTVIDPDSRSRTAFGRPRRFVLRSEVEALLREREAGQGDEGDREAAG